MFVPCPHCGFLVALIVSRSDASQRCPRCGQPLQLSDATAHEPATTAPADPAAEDDTAATVADADAMPASTSTAASTTDAALASPPAPAPPRRPRSHATRTPRSAPSFARRSVSMFDAGPRWRGGVAVAVLLAALVLQLLLAQRHALAADAGWRPTVATLCNVIGCRLRPWREPGAFTMLARNVRPADGSGVLQVQASFRNDAQWPQPWPRLLLRLNDRHGRTVGERLFTPAEYLGARTSTPELLAPGQSASVDFAVREPGADIVAFDFDFR